MNPYLTRWTQREQENRDRLLGPLVDALPAWVVPNHFSWLRLVLLLLAVAMNLAGAALLAQLVVLAVAWLTDTLDGPLARRRGLVSQRGAQLDQMSDMMIGVWMGVLALSRGLLSRQLVALMVLPELIMLLVRWEPHWFGQRPEDSAAGDWPLVFEHRGLRFYIFPPTFLSRLQFVFVFSGFWMLLAGWDWGMGWLRQLGTLLLYGEVVCSWGLALQWALEAIRPRIRNRAG